MSKVFSGISMSLDGFVTGPNVTREQQLGDGGQALFQWLHTPDPRDAELLAEMRAEVGSIVMGRLSYDLTEGDGGFGDGGPAGKAPCFVLTHSPLTLLLSSLQDGGLGSPAVPAWLIAPCRSDGLGGVATGTVGCVDL